MGSEQRVADSERDIRCVVRRQQGFVKGNDSCCVYHVHLVAHTLYSRNVSSGGSVTEVDSKTGLTNSHPSIWTEAGTEADMTLTLSLLKSSEIFLFCSPLSSRNLFIKS